MEKKMDNEELQNRREFFKKAAKGALPILGFAFLASNPIVAKAHKTAMGCTGTCYQGCYGGCKGCQYSCSGTCKGSCRATCQWSSK